MPSKRARLRAPEPRPVLNFPGRQRRPSPVTVPSVDNPVVGNDAITAHDLLVGADLQAFNGASALGSGFATAATNYMKVSPKIATGEQITADQVLCSPSDKSPPATAVSQLKPRLCRANLPRPGIGDRWRHDD